jgi:hypothetical protein
MRPCSPHHYAEACRPEDLDLAWLDREEEAERLRGQAVRWSRRAADLAVGRYEIDQGLALLHRALELEPDPGRQAELWHRIGQANALKFDGEAFWAAMEKAIEIGGPSPDLHAELAFQSVRRYGMWKREPDTELIEGWIDRALELAEEGSANQARALYARSSWNDDEPAARALHAIAERLADPQLRSLALGALANAAWGAGDLGQACVWTDQQLDLLPELSDPDDRTRALLDAVLVYLNAGNLPPAASAAALHVELAEGLTPTASPPARSRLPNLGGGIPRPVGRRAEADVGGRAGGGCKPGRRHALSAERLHAPPLRGCECLRRQRG